MYDKLMRETMQQYIAGVYSFGDSEARKRLLAHLRNMTDEEYSEYTRKLADAMAKLPCHECGCEFNGKHDNNE